MRSPARAWIVSLAAGAIAAVLVWHVPPPAPSWHALPPEQVQYAFWTIFVAVISAIWNGLEVAGRITLQALAWSVKALWAFAGAIANAAKAVGKALAIAGKEIWQFMRTTIGKAVVAGWKKLWTLVDRFRAWLERSFKPVLDFLFKIRDRLMKFYTDWIRPVLDVIDIGRKALRVLGALGIEWAKALDRRLMEIQEAIDRPFRAVLAKVNEIIGLVNRVVTADGLFQRLALIRSIERDVKYAARAFTNTRTAATSEKGREAITKGPDERDVLVAASDVVTFLNTGEGPRGPWIRELAANYRIALQRVNQVSAR